MGRTKLTLKPFIDICVIKGCKKGFKVLENGDMVIETPRWSDDKKTKKKNKKPFDADYEEIHKDYETYNKRKYKGYSKTKGTIIAAIKKSKLYSIISLNKGMCVFREKRCDSSPGSSGYGSEMHSPKTEIDPDYLDQVSSPERTDFSSREQNYTSKLSGGGIERGKANLPSEQLTFTLIQQIFIVDENGLNASSNFSGTLPLDSNQAIYGGLHFEVSPHAPEFPEQTSTFVDFGGSQHVQEFPEEPSTFAHSEVSPHAQEFPEQHSPLTHFEGSPHAQEFPEEPSTFAEQCLSSDLMDINLQWESPPLLDEQFNDLLKSDIFSGSIDFLDQEKYFATRVLPGNSTLIKPINMDCQRVKQ